MTAPTLADMVQVILQTAANRRYRIAELEDLLRDIVQRVPEYDTEGEFADLWLRARAMLEGGRSAVERFVAERRCGMTLTMLLTAPFPQGIHVTCQHDGRELLGVVVSLHWGAGHEAVLTVKHMNGDYWPLQPRASQVRFLDRGAE